jgi:hypothetical protein
MRRQRKRNGVCRTNIVLVNDMTPPDDGPSIMLNEPKKKEEPYCSSINKPAKKVYMDAANAQWYDTIYHGGTSTKLPNDAALGEIL